MEAIKTQAQQLTRHQIIILGIMGSFLFLYLCNVINNISSSSDSALIRVFPGNFTNVTIDSVVSTPRPIHVTTLRSKTAEYDDLTY